MITIEKIVSSTFPKLYDSFLFDDDPYSTEQDWRNVFDYRWDHGEGHCGYAMLDNDTCVGMMGMVFSRRRIHCDVKKFCNLHTWWVREDYRGRSLALLRPLLRLDGYTITHFTPCERIDAITKKLGYKRMDKRVKILLPLGHRRAPGVGQCEILEDEAAIQDVLSEDDRRILNDHRPYGCRNLVVRDGDEYCYILFARVVRHWMPYCHYHYISNKDLFLKHERKIRAFVLDSQDARFAAIDSRFVKGINFPRSFHSRVPAHGLYKSTDVEPEQIDYLYSDVSLLSLTVFPDISHELIRCTKMLLPWGASSRD